MSYQAMLHDAAFNINTIQAGNIVTAFRWDKTGVTDSEVFSEPYPRGSVVNVYKYGYTHCEPGSGRTIPVLHISCQNRQKLVDIRDVIPISRFHAEGTNA